MYAYTTGALGMATSTDQLTYGDTSWKDLLTAYNGNTITYDGGGNPLTYNGWTYTWQQGRELASAKNSSCNISYTYNDAGLRTSKTVNGVTTNYLLDANGNILRQSDGTNTLWFYYDASGSPVSLEFNGVAYYYTFDGQGEITGIMDASGTNLVVRYIYDAYGNVTVSGSLAGTVGAANPLRYKDYIYDNETGLYYLQSRYYSATWGRFLNADCIVDTQDWANSANMFAYCWNNPVVNVDFNGTQVVKTFKKDSSWRSIILSDYFLIPVGPWWDTNVTTMIHASWSNQYAVSVSIGLVYCVI